MCMVVDFFFFGKKKKKKTYFEGWEALKKQLFLLRCLSRDYNIIYTTVKHLVGLNYDRHV